MFPVGTLLYKFNEYEGLQTNASPWWSEVVSNELDGGLLQRLALGQALGLQEFTRVSAAVSENWNPLHYLLIAELRTDVFGFKGKVAGQARYNLSDKDKEEGTKQGLSPSAFSKRMKQHEKQVPTKNLVGNAGQVFIPNLITITNIRVVRSYDITTGNLDRIIRDVRNNFG